MPFKHTSLISLLIIFGFESAFGQQIDEAEVEIRTYSGMTSSNISQLDWANKGGAVYPNSANLILNTRFKSSYNYRGIENEFFFDLTNRVTEKSRSFFSEFYLRNELKHFVIKTGWFSRTQGLDHQTEVGLGSILLSNNAAPLPGVEIRTKEFLSAPFFSRYLKYKASFGNFWFKENRFVENVKLHSKEFYLQLDFNSIKLSGGVIHNVMWGGESPTVGGVPESFMDFIRVVFAQPNPNSSITSEIDNALGNTIAGYDFAVQYQDDDQAITLSRIFYIEDEPGTVFRSAYDGQWTATWTPNFLNWLNYLRYEHVYTIRQDAKTFQPDGRANYYNHSIYTDGWSNYDMVLGSPLIGYDPDLNRIVNNILVAHSVRFEMPVSPHFKVQSTFQYSRNYGVCSDFIINPEETRCGADLATKEDAFPRSRFREDAFSWALNTNYSFPGLEKFEFSTSISHDINTLFNTGVGVSFGIKYKVR